MGKMYVVAVLPPPVGTLHLGGEHRALARLVATDVAEHPKTTDLPGWEARRDRPTLGSADGS